MHLQAGLTALGETLAKSSTHNLEHCQSILRKPLVLADDLSTVLFFLREASSEVQLSANRWADDNRQLAQRVQDLEDSLAHAREENRMTADEKVQIRTLFYFILFPGPPACMRFCS